MAYKITGSCIACGDCQPACGMEAIFLVEEDIYEIDQELCNDCATCVDYCPVDAIVPAEE
jgi:MinD superfamily P-loop ATPase